MPPTTISMWSDAAAAVVPWAVSRRDEYDGGGNLATVVLAERLGPDGTVAEALRFSPNTTDHELAQYVKDVNRRHSHDRNAPEVD